MAAGLLNGILVPLSGDKLIDAMTSGYKWQLGLDRNIDWSISDGWRREFWNNPTEVVAKFSQALSMMSYYANIKFTYTGYFLNPGDANLSGSDINLALDSGSVFGSSTNIWARGYFPNPNDNNRGDIYVNINSSANNISYELGSAGWFLILHEIGHTLGLKHPHDDGGTGRPTFSQLGWSSLDIDLMTMMSYEDDYDFNLTAFDPATPMILDVLALQYLYGKNMLTNAGDSRFILTNTNFYATLWDASGSDVIDQSGASEGWYIVLPDIYLSSLVDTKAGYAIPMASVNLTSPTSLYWLAGDFENVIGSAYSDHIYLNSMNNVVDGGGGLDTVFLNASRSQCTITFSSGQCIITSLDGGTDILSNVEYIGFSDRIVPVTNLSTADTTAPSVSTFTPADGATGVAVGNNIVLTFSEAIARGTGTITIRSGSASGTIVESFDAATSNRISISGSTLTIDPTNNLAGNTRYFVLFSSGNVRDLAGNAYRGTSTYDFTTVGSATDTTAPTVTSFSPADATTGVAVGNNIVLTFSEAIARGTGTITIRSGSATGTIVESFDAATSSRISISGSTLTIDPTNNLAGNTRYFVVFSSGNVRDLAGNAYRGTSTYDFTTGSAPTTTSDDYPNSTDTTGVVTIGGAATTGSIETTGDLDLFRVSLTAGGTYTFNLNATSGSLDSVLVLRNSALVQLAENDDYGSSLNSQITFTATSSGTYYLQARSFGTNTGTYSLQGTAADTTAPTVSAFTPADGATAVAVGANIVLTFSENIAKGTGTITLRSGSATGAIVESFDAASSNRLTVSGSTLTIDPTNDLSANTQYFVVFTSGNIKDTAGNAYAGISTYDFRTAAADATAPTVTSFSPTDAATGVAVGNNIVLTFSEAIARGTGTITVRSGSASGTIVESFDAATSNRISISGSTLTIDPTNNLAGNTRYFVVFSSGNVRDLAGNAYRGTSTYDFTTGSAPTTTSDDYTNTIATTGRVFTGSSPATGTIEVAGDVDAFRVSLTAGVTYTFNLNATSGALDPYLSLYNSSLTLLAYNDDFGSSRNSQITFTATSSGTYYLAAKDFGTGTGTYSLGGTAADDYSAPATGLVTVGGSPTTGRIDYADDIDAFRVVLTAGVTYTFNLNAISGTLDPGLALYDSSLLTMIAFNDDFGSSRNAQITFTATSSGTYYLLAFGTDTGTYSLQGRIGSTSAIAQSALSVAPADSLGRSDGMAPETDLAMIPPSKSNEPGNQIGVIEAEILLALANSNDPFANEHLALQNFSVNQGAHPQSILLEHSPHTTHYSVADTFHFGSEDVLEHFRNDDVALTRTQFNAVIFDPAHHWTANSAFDPAIYNGDEVIFDVTEFGSLSTANGYHQVDFIL